MTDEEKQKKKKKIEANKMRKMGSDGGCSSQHPASPCESVIPESSILEQDLSQHSVMSPHSPSLYKISLTKTSSYAKSVSCSSSSQNSPEDSSYQALIQATDFDFDSRAPSLTPSPSAESLPHKPQAVVIGMVREAEPSVSSKIPKLVNQTDVHDREAMTHEPLYDSHVVLSPHSTPQAGEGFFINNINPAIPTAAPCIIPVASVNPSSRSYDGNNSIFPLNISSSDEINSRPANTLVAHYSSHNLESNKIIMNDAHEVLSANNIESVSGFYSDISETCPIPCNPGLGHRNAPQMLNREAENPYSLESNVLASTSTSFINTSSLNNGDLTINPNFDNPLCLSPVRERRFENESWSRGLKGKPSSSELALLSSPQLERQSGYEEQLVTRAPTCTPDNVCHTLQQRDLTPGADDGFLVKLEPLNSSPVHTSVSTLLQSKPSSHSSTPRPLEQHNLQSASSTFSDSPPSQRPSNGSDDWSDFRVLDALRKIQPGCKELPSSSSEGTVVDSIVNFAVAAEYLPFSALGGKNRCPSSLTPAEEDKLNELKTANAAMMAPLSEDLEYEKQHNPSLINVINMTDIAIRRIIEMSKQLSSFSCLCTKDQIALLKGSCTEMLILRSVTAYDADKESWKIPEHRDSFKFIRLKVLKAAPGNVHVYEEHKRFILAFKPEWRHNQNIMLLLSAITLFTPSRANVVHPDAIQHEQVPLTLYSPCARKVFVSNKIVYL